jgi:NAD(P)-dependent dehydrogenase (short-subunit alcohol dehydrogenase family)
MTVFRMQVCDLSSLQQVRDFAAKYASTNQPLHILVNLAKNSAPFAHRLD